MTTASGAARRRLRRSHAPRCMHLRRDGAALRDDDHAIGLGYPFPTVQRPGAREPTCPAAASPVAWFAQPFGSKIASVAWVAVNCASR